MTHYEIVVFDLGKTNKKLILFDQDLNMLDQEKIVFEEYEEGNIRYDPVTDIERWLFKTLRKFARSYSSIKSISISAHGATFVGINESGKISFPEISYTTDPGDDFHAEFFREFGNRKALQLETGTPDFNLLINTGKGIWFAKKRFPAQFSKTKYILNFPQYFGYKLTGIAGTEPTYTGCHTYLWNFHTNEWSAVTRKMGILPLLPPRVSRPWDILGRITPSVARETGLAEETTVTLGIHDSNASLLPYLITMKQDFVLNSTGTWCVIMHEKKTVEFRDEELGKVVFYNLNAFSRPVKTSIFMGGLEFDSYMEILKKLNRMDRTPDFDYEVFSEIIRKRELFILPSVTKGTGQFPDSEPRIIEKGQTFYYDNAREGKSVPGFFHDYETAYAVLILSLVIQTKISLNRVDMVDGLPLFIEGGFSHNDSYTNLLTSFYPASEIFITSLNEATAYGAAILSKASVENKHPEQLRDLIHIEKIKVPVVAIKGIDDYVADFLKKI